MKLKDLLSSDHVAVDLRLSDKRAVLQELAQRAAAATSMPEERIVSELLKREELGSTGVGAGIAIPHTRMPEVKKPFGVLVRLKDAIDFGAIDGQPVDIVFLLLLPPAPAAESLAALATVTRKLRDGNVLGRLRSAQGNRQIYDAIVGET